MPVLARASLAIAAAVTSLSICSLSAAQTAFIGANFSGSYSGSTPATGTPPDTMGAVGGDYYVELLNGVFATYSKTGTLVGTRVTDQQFWVDAFTNAGTSFDPGTSLTDPRLVFDQNSQRWFAVQVTTASPDYQVLVARSNTSDPTQGFKAVRFAATSAGGVFPDYPTLGVDANGVYIGANLFPDNNSAPTIALYSLPKADLLQSTPSVEDRTSFLNKSVGQYGWTPQPVVDFGDAKGAAVVYSVSSANPVNSTTINKFTISNTDGAGATISSFATSITVPAYTAPPDAQQPGTTLKLDGLDGRFQSAVYQVRNDVWAVQSVYVAGRAGIRWYRINPNNNTVIASGTLSDPNFDYTQPSISANTSGAVVIGFTRSGGSSPSGNPGAYAFVGTTNGSATTFGSIITLKAGEGNYVPDPLSPQRWGDYSATTNDPADPGIFWTSQEYARSGGDAWGVQTSEIIVPGVDEARWRNAASGSFGSAGNWMGGAPNLNSHVVLSRPGAAYTVTVSGDTTINRLSARQGDATIDLGGSSLILTNISMSAPSLIVGEFASSPRLTVRNGSLSSHITQISPNRQSNGGLILDNVLWTSDAGVTLGNDDAAPALLALTGTSSAQITGALSLYCNATLNNSATTLTAGSITLVGGLLLDAPGGSRVLRTNSLYIADGGKIDLNDNSLILDYTGSVGSAEGEVRGDLIYGRNCGTWDGPGLASTTAGTDPLHLAALGYAEASDLCITSWAGQPVDDTTIIVRYTIYGDANLNGVIDPQDYALLYEAYYGFYYASWYHGDFNYDGVIDARDFMLIDISLGRQQGLPPELLSERDAEFGQPYVDQLLDNIPEPSSVSLLAPLLTLLTSRRRTPCRLAAPANLF